MSVRDIIQAAAGVGGGGPNPWDLDFASSPAISRGPSIASVENAVAAVNVKNDGTQMYVTGGQYDTVYQYNFLTPYMTNTAAFTRRSVSGPQGFYFKPDGTKMYSQNVGIVTQYDLSTAWNPATATAVATISAGFGTSAAKISFKDDGTVFFITNTFLDTIYAYSLSTAWDISSATYTGVSKDVSAQVGNPVSLGMYVGDSGTKLYLSTSTSVFAYTLSTPWDLSTLTYTGVSKGVSTQENQVLDCFFSFDGIYMYVVGANNRFIYQYTLGTAWDVSTATYTRSSYLSLNTLYGMSSPRALYMSDDGQYVFIGGNGFIYAQSMSIAWNVGTARPGYRVSDEDNTPQGMAFKSDGTKMYIVGSQNDSVYQYSLSVPWEVFSANYDSVSFSVASQETDPRGVAFKTDGTKMYVVGTSSDAVNEYALGTPWDISTASYTQNFSVLSEAGTTPQKAEFSSDGTKMYVISSTNDTIFEYVLSSAWDVSTASYSSVSYNVAAMTGESTPVGLSFADSGSKMYIIGQQIDRVLGFPLGTAWELSTANSYSFYVASQEATPTSVTFKTDGTEMYVLGTTGDDVNQYSVSSAWSVQSASYVRLFLVSGQTGTTPQKVQFKDDGTKMYVLSNTNDAIYQYSLSTAWDISSATYDAISFSVTGQEATPRGMFIGDSGTKLYVVGDTSDTVFQYALSSAWDLSTASYESKSFSVSAQEATPYGLFLGDNGAQMYIVGATTDSVYQYTLATPWDVSTATYVNKSFSVNAYEGTPQAVWFKDDGTSFYVTGSGGIVWEFTIS